MKMHVEAVKALRFETLDANPECLTEAEVTTDAAPITGIQSKNQCAIPRDMSRCTTSQNRRIKVDHRAKAPDSYTRTELAPSILRGNVLAPFLPLFRHQTDSMDEKPVAFTVNQGSVKVRTICRANHTDSLNYIQTSLSQPHNARR